MLGVESLIVKNQPSSLEGKHLFEQGAITESVHKWTVLKLDNRAKVDDLQSWVEVNGRGYTMK